MITELLDEISVPAEAAVCNDVGECNHRNEIERYYDEITDAMSAASKMCIPTRKHWRVQRPGWNNDVRKLPSQRMVYGSWLTNHDKVMCIKICVRLEKNLKRS